MEEEVEIAERTYSRRDCRRRRTSTSTTALLLLIVEQYRELLLIGGDSSTAVLGLLLMVQPCTAEINVVKNSSTVTVKFIMIMVLIWVL